MVFKNAPAEDIATQRLVALGRMKNVQGVSELATRAATGDLVAQKKVLGLAEWASKYTDDEFRVIQTATSSLDDPAAVIFKLSEKKVNLAALLKGTTADENAIKDIAEFTASSYFDDVTRGVSSECLTQDIDDLAKFYAGNNVYVEINGLRINRFEHVYNSIVSDYADSMSSVITDELIRLNPGKSSAEINKMMLALSNDERLALANSRAVRQMSAISGLEHPFVDAPASYKPLIFRSNVGVENNKLLTQTLNEASLKRAADFTDQYSGRLVNAMEKIELTPAGYSGLRFDSLMKYNNAGERISEPIAGIFSETSKEITLKVDPQSREELINVLYTAMHEGGHARELEIVGEDALSLARRLASAHPDDAAFITAENLRWFKEASTDIRLKLAVGDEFVPRVTRYGKELENGVTVLESEVKGLIDRLEFQRLASMRAVAEKTGDFAARDIIDTVITSKLPAEKVTAIQEVSESFMKYAAFKTKPMDATWIEIMKKVAMLGGT